MTTGIARIRERMATLDAGRTIVVLFADDVREAVRRLDDLEAEVTKLRPATWGEVPSTAPGVGMFPRATDDKSLSFWAMVDEAAERVKNIAERTG